MYKKLLEQYEKELTEKGMQGASTSISHKARQEFALWLNNNAAQQIMQFAPRPHEHLRAEFDYICAGCGDLVKRRPVTKDR